MKEFHQIFKWSVRRLRPGIWALAVAGLTALPALAADETAKPGVDAQADKLLRRMGNYLGQAQFFSVKAEIWEDVIMTTGQKVQAARCVDLQVRRPNRLHTEVRSTRRNRALFYDGKSLTLLNRAEKFYGTIAAPASLDEALDKASERFGLTLPLEDLIVSDPYQSAIAKVNSGVDIGPSTILGTPCEHLAFSQDGIDWQIWIEDGARPVPRKMILTYKDEEGSPQYTAIFSGWDFETKLPDFLFQFEPVAGEIKIRVAEIKAENQKHQQKEKKP